MRRELVIKNENAEPIIIPIRMTISALRMYRTEFGRDFIQDLVDLHEKLNPDPLRKAMSRLRIDATKAAGMTQKEISGLIMENVDFTELAADSHLTGEETDRALQLVYVLAKNADSELKPFENWADSFDVLLPVKSLIDACFDLWNQSNETSIEIKN